MPEENKDNTPENTTDTDFEVAEFDAGRKVFANVNTTGETHIKMFGYVGGDAPVAFPNTPSEAYVSSLTLSIKQNVYGDYPDLQNIEIKNISIETAKALERALKLAIATSEGKI